MGILTAVWHHAIEILLPSRCVGCGTGGTYLCDGCIGRAPRAAAVGLDAAGDALDAVTAPLAFEGTARTAVHRLKYSGLRAIAPAMARPMAEALGTEPLLIVAESHGGLAGGGEWPKPLRLGVSLVNNHLQYAITWFSLALIWAVMSAMLVRRERPRLDRD